MSEPFHHEDQFRWTDPDLARETVRLLLWPHTLSLAGPRPQFDARMWFRRIQNIVVTDITYGTDVTIVPGRLDSFFAVMLPLSGSAVIRCGGQTVRSERRLAAVATASQPLSMRWSADCAQRIVRIERPAIEAQLSEMLGHSLGRPLEFSLGMELGGGYARIFAEEIARLVALLDRDPHAFAQPLVATITERMLMTRLLQGAQHNYQDDLAAQGTATPSQIVRRAVDLIDSHPEWEHTVDSLALAVGVSRRSLERAFRKHKGVSPWRYVKSVRLRRAYDELRAADPGQLTVGDVARRWGMTHSQFSAEYRRAYGETPTETLQGPARLEVPGNAAN